MFNIPNSYQYIYVIQKIPHIETCTVRSFQVSDQFIVCGFVVVERQVLIDQARRPLSAIPACILQEQWKIILKV